MAHEIIRGQNLTTRNKVRESFGIYSSVDPDKVNAKRERFLALLSRQYGYTNDKAVDELERILKEFYRVNRLLGFQRSRGKSKRPDSK